MRWIPCLLVAGLLGCGAPSVPDTEPTDEATRPAAALPVPGKAQVYNTTGLNLRAGPGTGYAVLTVMPSGAEVDVVAGPQNNFYKVVYAGTTGWASGSYLQAVSSPGGPGGGVWRPGPGTSWQWQLSGTVDPSFNVKMYDVDLFDTPQATIDGLHARGRVVICYFSAGSYENWRSDAGSFPSAVLGQALDGWPGERWIDTRAASLREIMKKRLDLARQKKCDGVEPDNVDGYANSSGFPLSAATQLDYNRFLSREAHARGLSVGLKNDLDQVPQLLADFDWALNEECFKYSECAALSPFINAGKAVFQVEYGDQSTANRVCPQANARNFDTLVKKLDLTATRIACR